MLPVTRGRGGLGRARHWALLRARARGRKDLKSWTTSGQLERLRGQHPLLSFVITPELLAYAALAGLGFDFDKYGTSTSSVAQPRAAEASMPRGGQAEGSLRYAELFSSRTPVPLMCPECRQPGSCPAR